MSLQIIYGDEEVIVLNKPAGVLVYPDKYTKSGTILEELTKHYPKVKNVGELHRPGIVHRLDRETSGLLLCAKNQKAYQFLISQFKEKKVQKKYYVLVYGRMKEKSGTITYNLAKKGRKTKEKALTYYKVLQCFGDRFTLLEVEIKTGIMHQIRQHLKMLGYPIVGDKEYTFKNLNPPFPIDRQFLHAYYLRLELPSGGVKKFEIKLPEELKKYLEKIQNPNVK